jgi:hypothetical protein
MPDHPADTPLPGIYRFIENGVAYYLNFRQLNNYKISRKRTVAEWYNSLNKFARKEIKVLPHTEI